MLETVVRRIVPPPAVAAAPPPPTSAASVASQALELPGQQNSIETRQRCLSCHPSLPLVAYTLDVLSDGSTTSTSSSLRLSPQRQLVVQHVVTKQVLWKMSLRDLAIALFDLNSDVQLNVNKSATRGSTSARVSLALKSMGTVQRIDFFDPSTLFHPLAHQPTDNDQEEWFQFLILQLHHRVVLWDIRRNALVGQISEKSLKSAPTSSLLPLTHSLAVVGCADGSLRLWDRLQNRVLKSARAGNTNQKDTTAALWHLVATNASHKSSIKLSGAAFDLYTLRLVAINKKGVAYVWELVLQDNTLVEIRPPLARLEGHFVAPGAGPLSSSSISSSSAHGGASHSNAAGGETELQTMKSEASKSADPSGGYYEHMWDHVPVDYDGHRDFFLWWVPHGYKGSNKPHVLLWDLSTLSFTESSKKTKTPKPDPFIMTVSLDQVPANITLCAGWIHPSFSSEHLVCAAVTPSGELHVLAMPLSSSSNPSTTKPGRAVAATLLFSVSLSSVLQRDSGISLSLPPPMIQAYSLTAPRRLDTAALVVGTDLGLLWVEVQETVVTGAARHVHFGAGMAEWSHSVLYARDYSSVVWASLQVPDKNPRGVVATKPFVQVYQSSTVLLQLPPEKGQRQPTSRPVGLPPRFLASPSGNYLCLYWHDEERYEILHLRTVLRRTMSDGSSFSPAVSSGSNVLSFAWVGEDDVFAVLHAPSEQRDASLLVRADSFRTATTGSSSKDSSPQVSGMGGSKKNAFRKSFDFVRKGSPSVAGGGGGKSLSTPSSAINEDFNADTSSSSLARVELKALVGVAANAAEISGSVSAATETTLGDLTLRGGGGNRNPPTALFGGPVLCVMSKETQQKNGAGTAYFYSRKADEQKNRASAYVSSGPALPCPDFVVWDEDGGLCAVVIESRVAVYLNDPPQFVLLGNVQLGSPTEANVTVTGAKFVHGVLYCTTKTSVQVIFLGDLEGSGICHLDSFVLAALNPVNFPPDKTCSWAPPCLSMTLNHPIILGYQSGSLLLSTATGVLEAIPLDHPVLRIGCLLGAGQSEARILPWCDLVENHEALALFLERRGHPELAVNLPRLSLQTQVDLCLRHSLTEQLQDIVETFSLERLYQLDVNRGTSTTTSEPSRHSLVVCIGAYLLSQGKAELVRRLATECLRLEEGKRDAFVLSGLFLAVDPSDARRLMKRAVGTTAVKEESPVFGLIRDHIL